MPPPDEAIKLNETLLDDLLDPGRDEASLFSVGDSDRVRIALSVQHVVEDLLFMRLQKCEIDDVIRILQRIGHVDHLDWTRIERVMRGHVIGVTYFPQPGVRLLPSYVFPGSCRSVGDVRAAGRKYLRVFTMASGSDGDVAEAGCGQSVDEGIDLCSHDDDFIFDIVCPRSAPPGD